MKLKEYKLIVNEIRLRQKWNDEALEKYNRETPEELKTAFGETYHKAVEFQLQEMALFMATEFPDEHDEWLEEQEPNAHVAEPFKTIINNFAGVKR